MTRLHLITPCPISIRNAGTVLAALALLAACGGGSNDNSSDASAGHANGPQITAQQLAGCPTQAQSPLDYTQLGCLHGSVQGRGHVEGSEDMAVECQAQADASGIRLQIKDQEARTHALPAAPNAVSSYVRVDDGANISINLQSDLYADKDDTIVDGIHVSYQKSEGQLKVNRLGFVSIKDGIEQSCTVDF